MKKITLLASVLFFGISTNAQIFSDNFDGYTLNYLGPQSTGAANVPQWSTWSNADGTTEDVMVSNAQSQSPSQSLYFSSTVTTGGPTDCLLKLGQVYNSGIFTFETSMMVPAGKTAHFNFQKTATPGQVWTLNVYCDNGSLTIDDAITANLATTSYTNGQWFTLKIEANLTLGIWEAFLNGSSIGTWNNGTNAVASVDFFPPDQNSQFYIDDVSFDHQTYTLPNLNAIASNVNMNGNIATQTVNPTGKVTNGGQTTITSMTAVLNYNGSNYTQNLTGLNIASTSNYTVNFGGVALVAGSNTATMTISNVNGGADDNNTDNVVTTTVNPVVPAPGKMVVSEEATGTWCGWCPRGTVYMDRFKNSFHGFWAGIAVHNGDPMTVTDYDAGIGGFISGYPSSLVDRGADTDPSDMYTQFYARLQVAPKAFITTPYTWNATTRELAVTVTANFQAAANNNYKLGCVLTEDHVTGTGSGYNQTNYYSSASNNIDLIDDNGLNWKTLPASVPAAQMEYNHVARAIMPSFSGDASSFPATVNAGETHSKTYLFTLPATWSADDINIVGLLFDPTGRIDNASEVELETVTGVSTIENPITSFTLYPNPATSHASVNLEIANESEVEISLIDLNGKVMTSKNFGSIAGTSTIDLNTSSLSPGVYLVKVAINDTFKVERLVIQ